MHLWFLLLSLLLPRTAIVIGWFFGFHYPFLHPWDLLAWVFVPRLTVLIMVYRWRGYGFWFWLHLFAALMAYGAGGRTIRDRRRDREL